MKKPRKNAGLFFTMKFAYRRDAIKNSCSIVLLGPDKQGQRAEAILQLDFLAVTV